MASPRPLAVGLVLFALFAGACSAPTDTAAPSPSETPFVQLPLDQAVDRFLDDPYEVEAALLADRFGETGDVGYVPHLVDLLRFGTTDDLAIRAGEALAELTGVPRPDDRREAYLTYGTWLETHDIEPAGGYIDWKSRLLADVDGDARGYPLRIMGHHELANDELGGDPVAMTFCTLCRTAILFDRRVDGRTLTFRTSGLLLRSNKVMVHVETQTLWEQLTGRALAGEHEGRELERFTTTATDSADWLDRRPDTDVLDIPDPDLPTDDRPFPGGYSYEPGEAYRSYYESDELWFPGLDTPDVLPRKAEVLTVARGGEALAISVEELRSDGPTVVDLAGGWIVAVPTAAGGRLYLGDGERPASLPEDLQVTEEQLVLPDGRRLPRADHAQSLWFAWYARHPDTRVWHSTGISGG